VIRRGATWWPASGLFRWGAGLSDGAFGRVLVERGRASGAKRLFVTQRLFEDTVPTAFAGSSIEVDVRDADEPLEAAELATVLADFDGVVCLLTDRLDESVLEANRQLEVISNVAVGVDNIDLPVARRLGITVTNTPDVLTETTADLAVALMLAVARRLPEADDFVRSGSWSSWKLSPSLMGVDLYGKTLGLFGMGRIGRAVARRAVHGFGMRLLYASRSPLPTEDERELGATRVDFADLLSAADVLSLHAPLTPETRHVLGAPQFAAMKPSAIVVNTARGPLVDESALADALEDGQIWGAGLDVFEDEPDVHPRLLAVRRRLVLAPHVGSATLDTRRRMADIAARDARAVLEGRAAAHPVSI
jgi:lactate dehydrogenase-like 2-hydroxyacid dehydrogenase